jgi:hypothetical protein
MVFRIRPENLVYRFIAINLCKPGSSHLQIFPIIQFAAGRAVPVCFFFIWVFIIDMFDMFQKPCGCIQFATDLTPFECMSTHDLIPDHNRSDITVIFIPNSLGRTDIGAGQASDAFTFI